MIFVVVIMILYIINANAKLSKKEEKYCSLCQMK